MLTRDPSRSRDTRSMQVDVTVVMRDGTTHKEACTRPPGSWGAPIDPKQHRVKLMECLGARLSEAEATGVLERLDHLEQLSADEVKQLIGVLAAA